MLRSVAHTQPHYYLDDLYELEGRIEKQLAGLMTAPDDAWPLCVEALTLEEPGELFVAAVLAFRCGDLDKIQYVVESSEVNEACLLALASALNWLKANQCHTWIKRFFQSKNFNHKRLALMACGLRRENPGDFLRAILRRDDCCDDELLFAQALKLVGDLKRTDCIEFVGKALESESPFLRWAGLKALVLLGERKDLGRLKPWVLGDTEFQSEAIQFAFRVLSVEEGRAWIGELAAIEGRTRQVIRATAALGDPHAIPWVIAQMKIPENAKLAGEAFAIITGIDLAQDELVIDMPEVSIDEGDEDDASIELDEDENLVYPSYELVVRKWALIQSQFVPGCRYFMGHMSTNTAFLLNLRDKFPQRIRSQAAIELALSKPSEPLQNIYSKLV